MKGLAWIESRLLEQRGHLFPWTPVFLAAGIGIYFSLRFEPGWGNYAVVLVLGGACTAAALRWPGGWSACAWALALIVAGFCLSGWRAHRVAAPVIPGHYYGTVEGRIVAMDRSASDALRITLDQVRLDRGGALPGRVRVSLHGDAPVLMPGERVMTTAYLSPPGGPVEPGGFDFRRHAWFLGLGAVGYTRVPVLTIAPPEPAALRVLTLRIRASRLVQSVLPGDVGGFAAAVTTGDRSGVSQQALQDLRASNLAHLLAISGLHMGLLAGFVFASLRALMVLIVPFALRWPVRKLAALGALAAASGYLMLSGGNVATERAFVMTAVMLGAVLVDRRAFSLRAVATAALIVLCLRPESLMGPGFQMSFAATTALVAVFGALREADIRLGKGWLNAVASVVLSSLVAGLATAPVAAAHFNTLSHYGLLANLLSVPLMGVLVIPAAVLAACLAPFGGEIVGLTLMGTGLEWILYVAHRIAELPGARGYVINPGDVVLPVLMVGALWLILWQGRGRWVGVPPVLIAIALWSLVAERPAVLVAEGGALVGVMTEAGRALSKPRGAGFAAGVWLENDGDGADQKAAAARWPRMDGPVPVIAGPVPGVEILHVTGKRAARGFDTCRKGQIVIAPLPLTLAGPCVVLDEVWLRTTGSLRIDAKGLVTARDMAGNRLWHARPRDRDWRVARVNADQ